MTQLQQGYDHDAPSTLRGLAYVAFQELATRISHRNTGRYSEDPVADKIMIRIAADENLHMVFYRDILGAALKIQPSQAVRAIVDEVLAFEMPGAGIPGFMRKAATIAKAGIYDLRVHRDEVLLPIIQHWRIFELTGLDAAAEEARRRSGRAPRQARRRPRSGSRRRWPRRMLRGSPGPADPPAGQPAMYTSNPRASSASSSARSGPSTSVNLKTDAPVLCFRRVGEMPSSSSGCPCMGRKLSFSAAVPHLHAGEPIVSLRAVAPQHRDAVDLALFEP